MAEIRTVVSVVDRATAVLRSVARSTQQIVRQMENAGGATVSVLQQQRAYNRALSEGKRRAFSLTEQVRSMAAAYLSLRGAAEAISAMDRHASGQARLSLLVEEERKIRETTVYKGQKPPPASPVVAKMPKKLYDKEALSRMQKLQKQIIESSAKKILESPSAAGVIHQLRKVQQEQRKIERSKTVLRIDSEGAQRAAQMLEKVSETKIKVRPDILVSVKGSKDSAQVMRKSVQNLRKQITDTSKTQQLMKGSLADGTIDRLRKIQQEQGKIERSKTVLRIDSEGVQRAARMLEKVSETKIKVRPDILVSVKGSKDSAQVMRKSVQNLQKQITDTSKTQQLMKGSLADGTIDRLRKIQQEQGKIERSKTVLRIDSEGVQRAARMLEKLSETRTKMLQQKDVFSAKETAEPKEAVQPPVASEKESLSGVHQQLERKKQLQDQIYAAAERSRGSYQNMVDVVSKLGILAKDSFSNSEEMIAFTEIMQKAFKVGGAGAQEQTSAMYQLTQAMAAGKLQGDEFRSISENAPLLAQAIAKVTGKSMGDLKELSSQGLITADVMKAAMFSMADEVNAKFETLPLTFADIGIKVKNVAGKIFEDTMNRVSGFLNSDMGSRLLQNITEDFLLIRQVVSGTLFVIGSVAGFFIQNWSMIRPVILAIATALSLYKLAMMAAGAVTALTTLSHTAQAIAIAMHLKTTVADAAAVHGLTAAQWALNGALWACPLTWIVVGILAVIAALYAGVAAHNRFAGAAVSATGIVVGVFYALGAFLMNLIKMLINQFLAFAEFLANVYHHPLYSTKKLFANWAESIINIIRSVASAIDKVFGSNLAGALDSFKSTIHRWVGEMPKGYKVMKKLEMTGLEEAFAKGYEVGESLKAKFDLTAGVPSFEELMNNVQMPQIPELSDIGKNAKKTADNTRGIKEELSAGDEELKWMRDIAAAEAVNRYSARNIHIEMKNTFGDIKETADVDGIIRKITEDLQESLSMEAEGAYDYV